MNITSKEILGFLFDLIKQLFDLFKVLSPYIASLFAVYLGWRLSQKSTSKQRAIDHLQQKFDAFREIKSVVDNIPSDCNKNLLLQRLKSEPSFCSELIEIGSSPYYYI